MVFGLTIAGASKLLKAGTLTIRETANRRCTAQFRIDSLDRSYRPAENAEVIITEDGDRIFGGLIDRPEERGMGGPKFPGISTTVTAVDFQAYAERRYFNGTLAAGTLKSQLQTLEPYLTGYGVTLDAGQVNGPAMPELVIQYERFDAVMNRLMTLTATGASQPFVWEIDYFKTFRAYQPSTELAPFDLVGNDLPEVVGDIEVEKVRSDGYANRVIVVAAPKTEIGRTESFTGDGTAGPFQLQYTVTRHYGHLTLDTGGGETMATDPADPGVAWEYDPVTNSLTRIAGNTVNGTIYSIYFDGVFSGAWTAEDAGEIASVGIVEKVIRDAVIDSDDAGQALADAELILRLQLIETVKYKTWEQGLAIGQQQDIDISSRNVSGTGVITDIESRDLVQRLERLVTVVIDASQTNIGRSFQDDYERWYGDKDTSGGGVSVSVGSGGTVSSGPAAPVGSVQFNRGVSAASSNAFGGDADFTYDEDTNSLVCGEDSSITAVSPSSCAVFGYDNHIADP